MRGATKERGGAALPSSGRCAASFSRTAGEGNSRPPSFERPHHAAQLGKAFQAADVGIAGRSVHDVAGEKVAVVGAHRDAVRRPSRSAARSSARSVAMRSTMSVSPSRWSAS